MIDASVRNAHRSQLLRPVVIEDLPCIVAALTINGTGELLSANVLIDEPLSIVVEQKIGIDTERSAERMDHRCMGAVLDLAANPCRHPMPVACIRRRVPCVAIREYVQIVDGPRNKIRHHFLVVAVVPCRQNHGLACRTLDDLPVDVLADHRRHASAVLFTDELLGSCCIDELAALRKAFLIDQRQQRLLTRQERHDGRIGWAVLLTAIVPRWERIVHHLQVDLRAVELCIRLLHHVDGRREVEHPVKVLAAVLRPVVPHALISTVAHLLHIFEDGGVLVKADAQLPLIAVADRAELSAAALPCARPLHDKNRRTVLRCCTRRRQARKTCADNDNVRTVRIADFLRWNLRCCPEPCGRRR